MKKYSISAFNEASTNRCPNCGCKFYHVDEVKTKAGQTMFIMRCSICRTFRAFIPHAKAIDLKRIAE